MAAPGDQNDVEMHESVEQSKEEVQPFKGGQKRKATEDTDFYSTKDDVGPSPAKIVATDEELEPEPIEDDEEALWNSGNISVVSLSNLPGLETFEANEANRVSVVDERDVDCSPLAARRDHGIPIDPERPFGIRRATRRFPITEECWEDATASTSSTTSEPDEAMLQDQ